MYIFALLGMEFFANEVYFTPDGDLITDLPVPADKKVAMIAPRENFDDIFFAVTTIFIVILGEDWNQVMYNYVRAKGDIYILYFLILMVMGNVMLLSSFTAILLANFEDNENKDDDDDGKDESGSESESESKKKKGPGICSKHTLL